MMVSCLMLAHQVASKAARDALFLSQFSPSYFPIMVMAGSALSIAGGLLNSRILQALTPARMVPWTFLFSAALHLGEWTLRELSVSFRNNRDRIHPRGGTGRHFAVQFLVIA